MNSDSGKAEYRVCPIYELPAESTGSEPVSGGLVWMKCPGFIMSTPPPDSSVEELGCCSISASVACGSGFVDSACLDPEFDFDRHNLWQLFENFNKVGARDMCPFLRADNGTGKLRSKDTSNRHGRVKPEHIELWNSTYMVMLFELQIKNPKSQEGDEQEWIDWRLGFQLNSNGTPGNGLSNRYDPVEVTVNGKVLVSVIAKDPGEPGNESLDWNLLLVKS